MRVSRLIVVIILVIIVAFRLLVLPVMRANDKEDNFMEFMRTTDAHLAEYDGALQNIEYIEQIKGIVIGDIGYAYVLDDSARILYHPNPDVIGSNINEFDIPEIMESISSLEYPGEERVIEYDFDGVTKLTRFYKDDYSRVIAFSDTYNTPGLIDLIIN